MFNPGFPPKILVRGLSKLIHREENSFFTPETRLATAHLSVSTKRGIAAWWFCVLLLTPMMLTASLLFYWKMSGSRTSGPRKRKLATVFVIRLWGNTSAHRILLPRPALGFAAKETGSSPKPQDRDHYQFEYYCHPSRVSYCLNRKPVFSEG